MDCFPPPFSPLPQPCLTTTPHPSPSPRPHGGRIRSLLARIVQQQTAVPILWTITYQAPLSLGFSRQEYCSGLPCPPPGDLPNPGIELVSLKSPAFAGIFFRATCEDIQTRLRDLTSSPKLLPQLHLEDTKRLILRVFQHELRHLNLWM